MSSSSRSLSSVLAQRQLLSRSSQRLAALQILQQQQHRSFATSAALLGSKDNKGPKGPNPRMRTSPRKYVEELRRRDDENEVVSPRAGQASRAFSPAMDKPFRNLDKWPPPASYKGKGHHRGPMSTTSMRSRPAIRPAVTENDIKHGWSQVLPGGRAPGQTLAERLAAKGFKKIRRFAGGVSGGAPHWIIERERENMQAELEGRPPRAPRPAPSFPPRREDYERSPPRREDSERGRRPLAKRSDGPPRKAAPAGSMREALADLDDEDDGVELTWNERRARR